MFAPPPPPAPPHDAFVPDNPVEEEPQSDKVIAFLTKKYSEMLVDPAEARKDACLSFVVPDDDARYHNVTPISIDIYSCHQKLQGTCTDSTLKDPDAAFCDGLPQHLRCDGVEYGMLRVKRGVFVSWDVGWEYLKLCQVTKGGMPFRAYHALLVERFRSQGVPCDSLNYECIKQFLYSFLIFLELDYNKKCMLCGDDPFVIVVDGTTLRRSVPAQHAELIPACCGPHHGAFENVLQNANASLPWSPHLISYDEEKKEHVYQHVPAKLRAAANKILKPIVKDLNSLGYAMRCISPNGEQEVSATHLVTEPHLKLRRTSLVSLCALESLLQKTESHNLVDAHRNIYSWQNNLFPFLNMCTSLYKTFLQSLDPLGNISVLTPDVLYLHNAVGKTLYAITILDFLTSPAIIRGGCDANWKTLKDYFLDCATALDSGNACPPKKDADAAADNMYISATYPPFVEMARLGFMSKDRTALLGLHSFFEAFLESHTEFYIHHKEAAEPVEDEDEIPVVECGEPMNPTVHGGKFCFHRKYDFRGVRRFKDSKSQKGPHDECNKFHEHFRSGTWGVTLFNCEHGWNFGWNENISSESMKDVRFVISTLMKNKRRKRRLRYVIYDFACGLQQYFMLRDPAEARNLVFLIDHFHAYNHKCSPIFKLTNYPTLTHINSSILEQMNSYLKYAILHQGKHMLDEHFMLSLMTHIAIWNNCKEELLKMFKNHSADDLAPHRIY